MRERIHKMLQGRRMKRQGKRFAAGLLTAVMALGLVSGNGAMAYANEKQEESPDLTDGLVGHWTFDGGSEDDAWLASEVTENLVAAKTDTGVSLSEDGGISGGGVDFSGTAGTYLTLKLSDANVGLTAETGSFSIGAWVKYREIVLANNVNTSVFHLDGDSAGQALLSIGPSDGNNKYSTFLGGASKYSTEAIETETWHHIMLVMDAGSDTKQVHFYVNGKETGSEALGSNIIYGNGSRAGDIRVGYHRAQESAAVNGIMDEIRYYDRVLSAEEIKTIFDVYGEQLETENLKAELQKLIMQAEGLSGGSEAAKESLGKIVAEAKALLNSDSATAAALTQKKTELQEAINAYEVIAPIAIAIDTADELRSIPSAMFGINHRYHNYGYGSWDAENDKIFDEFNLLAKDANFGSVRYPGGTVSNLFTWKDTIGPKNQRTTTIAGNNFYSNAGETPVDPAFGVDEAMTWIYDDLDSEAIFVYGLGRGNPQDAADLVEYLNAPNDGSNPNGGTDWAAVRAENGHEEPYGVIRFELGNEFSDTGQNYWMSGLSENNRGVTDLYIEGDRMTISGQTSYYQINNRVTKKGDWRASASLSGGLQNEERYVYYLPVVPDTAEVFVAGTKWNIVESLSGQGAKNVCTFDYDTGKITFGDGRDGNIPPSGAEIKCNYKTDQAGFVSYYDAMKEVADEVGMDIEIYSGIYDGRQNEFIDLMHEKGYDEKYDGVIIHPYSSGVTSYEDSLVKAKNFSNNIATYKNKMKTVTNDDSKKVAVSEFGILSVSPASNYQTSLGHAIYIANHMIDCVNAGAAYQNKHCLVDTTGSSDNLGAWQQCVIQSHQTGNGYEYVSTPSARLFSIFNNMTGSTEVGQTITGNTVFTGSGNSVVMNLNVYSTKDENGNVYVLAVNNKDRDVSPITISVDNLNLTGKEIEVWSLTSDQITDANTLGEPDKVAIQKTSVTGSGASLSYTLLPHSVYSFKISLPKKTTVKVEVGAEAGGTASGGMAEAEIGSKVTVNAQPNEGYEFAGWYLGGVKISEDASYTFEVTEPVSLTAKFTEKSIFQKVNVVVTAEAGGTASGTQSVSVGSKVTVTAQPNQGYEFAGWYNGSTKVSEAASYTFTVTGAVTLTARFQQQAAKKDNKTFAIGKFNYQILDTAKKTVMVQSGIAKKAKNVEKLTIPATVKIKGVQYKVTKIGPSAFLKYKKLTTVVIGKNVTEIGKNAFCNCSKLKSVTVKGVKMNKIRTGAFKKTAANISVKLPKSLKGKKGKALLTSFKKAGMSKKAKIK